MSEPFFFSPPPEVTMAELCAIAGAPTPPECDARLFFGVSTLRDAGPGDVAFYDNARHRTALEATRAGACCLRARDAHLLPPTCLPILVERPSLSFSRILANLVPDSLQPPRIAGEGVSPAAHVDSGARLELNVSVDPGAVIGAGVEIGENTRIGANVVIGPGVRIGRGCAIGAGSSLFYALLGDRVLLHPGVRLGQDGFGFAPGPRGWEKTPQVGRVIVQDDVEIGANTTVDRGALRDTIIGEGTKIDNLVQIGHNVIVGRRCVIVAQTGIAGSSRLGDGVVVGGQAGIAGHLKIGRGAQIAGQSGVVRDLEPGARAAGSPAVAATRFFRQAARGGAA